MKIFDKVATYINLRIHSTVAKNFIAAIYNYSITLEDSTIESWNKLRRNISKAAKEALDTRVTKNKNNQPNRPPSSQSW